MGSGHGLPDNDDFESISSTNLTIMNSLSPYDQSSLKRITKTISPSSTKQQLSLYSKDKERKERQNSANSRRQERKSAQPNKPPVGDVTSTTSNDSNELKQVFAKLQHKSVAQKLRQHLEEEEAERAKPAKETRDEDLKDVDGGSTSNPKSK